MSPQTTHNITDKLWSAAEQLRANSSLKLNEIAEPILGLIFLKFADVKFRKMTEAIQKEREGVSTGRVRPITPDDYKSRGVVFVPKQASYDYLLSLPEDSNIGKSINNAMKLIEQENIELAGILPNNYSNISTKADENSRLILVLLRNFNQIPENISGDAFGEIYEYFLGQFARSEGQKGGEFFTPQSIVKLIVEILEPYHGSIYDPACGSGGMFVASANFVRVHSNANKLNRNIMNDVRIFGQEKGEGNVRIAKMNLAIHGLSGKVEIANSFYEDAHKSVGKFDFVLANPPFNVKGKDKNKQIVIDSSKIKSDHRYPYGLPLTGKSEIISGNYLWIQMFATALSEKGRAGFVMANSASDAGNSEMEIRKKIIESGIVDVMISVGSNMFLNATLPCTLWFFDKSKKGTEREKKVLFINATDIYTPIDKVHNTWTDEQIQQITEIIRSYRGEDGAKKYKDVQGLCNVATVKEIESNGWSLTPGRYVGMTEIVHSHEDFEASMKDIQSTFLKLSQEAHILERKISDNFRKII
jgi:type I restriction enzyme M protein